MITCPLETRKPQRIDCRRSFKAFIQKPASRWVNFAGQSQVDSDPIIISMTADRNQQFFAELFGGIALIQQQLFGLLFNPESSLN